MFAEHQTRDVCPCLPGISVADLLGGHALLSLMHPRARRKAWQAALEQVATPVVRTAASKRAVKRDVRTLQKESLAAKRLKRKATLRQVAADVGLATQLQGALPQLPAAWPRQVCARAVGRRGFQMGSTPCWRGWVLGGAFGSEPA